MTGRSVSSRATTTALTSSVLRVRVSKVRMPRSQSTTSSLPRRRMYSEAAIHSSMVAEKPRFRITGLPMSPSASSSR